MKLRRYKKVIEDGRYRMEECDSSDFVAFWSDNKYISARDRDGVEWLLHADHSLVKIEAGAEGITRISRSTLVRIDAIELVRDVPTEGVVLTPRVFTAGGHEYLSSRRHRGGWLPGEYHQGCRRVA